MSQQWQERYAGAVMNTFGPPKLVLVRGAGAHVWDADGKEYVDRLGGIAVNALGHAHPAVVAAVHDGGPGHAAGDRVVAGLHLRDHAAVEARHQLLQALRADLLDHVVAVGPVAVEALHVGEHHQLLGTQRDRERGGRGVGVDVVHDPPRVGGHARDHRDASGLDEVFHGLGPDLRDLAHESEVDLLTVDDGVGGLGGEQAGVLT